ncbi:DNA adenine methylase [Abditibacterium utsteinense]|uniref:DNA adenine methylase n=1 Tax=Abditibacterium utsteinense TaxID=1960156 RepID=A0A2S8SQ94_9BACT|nr:DNA adenine methylase [Abditibacterium utsteinense]PQV62965.1 DNA adenine methylase [Abditibacterium utsteinense]
MQLTFEGTTDVFAGVINVASVPQRSPFRYPGGKSWIIPHLRRWFASLPYKPYKLVEPFAGGASVGLAVAFEALADRATLVEIDPEIAAVWHTILNGDAAWLAARIRGFDLNAKSARAVINNPSKRVEDRAFRTLIRNRVNHGGILAPGVGMLKAGENGKGIQSRWYPETLAKRIEAIACHRSKLSFLEADGLQVIENNLSCDQTVFFIDPPYTAAGKRAGARLYTHNALDHRRLFELASQIQGDFLMTYDDAEGVRDLAAEFGFETRAIAMKNTHHAKMTELLIGRNLHWV